MRAEFWMENPKGFLKRERERASIQGNFKSYLVDVALK
jgi:hypothetical protein